jgi:hypothetical protein
MEGHHSNILLNSRKADFPQAHWLFGGIMHDWIFGILEKMVCEEIEYVVMIILLVEYLAGENLN